eukprot:6176315-Pleurochrysis_carterae.AAC.3
MDGKDLWQNEPKLGHANESRSTHNYFWPFESPNVETNWGKCVPGPRCTYPAPCCINHAAACKGGEGTNQLISRRICLTYALEGRICACLITHKKDHGPWAAARKGYLP